MADPTQHLATLGLLVGGLGLFLLGMTMMTDGLKLAAGPALHRILSAATRTRWHALGSGLLVTAAVQASGAVTVAAIGFVNAGLLGLGPALWVLFGANLGTTTTGWIVAMIGLKFKVEALALPLVGIGMLMRLGADQRRRAALGSALAGFGLLFLGIATLQQSFGDLAAQVSLPQGTGVTAVLAQLLVGALMTVLMQSSSAAIAIALTAAQGGLIDIHGAAAVVIGANIGTTFTALMAAIGATANAKRAAIAHVAFNVLTGAVALVLLPWLLGALGSAGAALGLPPDPATKLAMFHTAFNLLGVLLMWPLAGALTRWLLQRFRASEDDEANPRHLDDNVLAVPALALEALQHEVARIGHVGVRTVRAVLAGTPPQALAREQAIVSQLDRAVATFVERMNRAEMAQETSERLARLLRIERYQESSVEQALAAAPLPVPHEHDVALVTRHAEFVGYTDALLAHCDALVEPPADQLQQTARQLDAAQMEAAYEALKAALLAAGAAGRMPLAEMEEALRRYSALRRAVQQSVKARQHAARLETNSNEGMTA